MKTVQHKAVEDLHSLANPEMMPDYMRFFKTGKEDYGEGDKFLGIKMPDIRKVIKQINNWDLVDVTAPHVVGAHLLNRDRTVLYEFTHSDDLWKKRIAIISTFAFINAHQYDDTLNIADILLHDTHDLIHKAVGWAIRNVGIKELHVELDFLQTRYQKMPRTMLRYAIEKFDESLRLDYLKGRI
ncbi:MAG: DNA alkylation repair protein [Campylobacterota bacterium]|nr:DNA alkylation repair protein [Campylobacterota bacterium]